MAWLQCRGDAKHLCLRCGRPEGNRRRLFRGRHLRDSKRRFSKNVIYFVSDTHATATLRPHFAHNAHPNCAEYAATYASPNQSGEQVMLLCMVVARNVYPISREDYAYPDKYQPGSVSRFHYQHPVPFCAATNTFDLEAAHAGRTDKGLKAGFGRCSPVMTPSLP